MVILGFGERARRGRRARQEDIGFVRGVGEQDGS
jgi:hypothetical protein